MSLSKLFLAVILTLDVHMRWNKWTRENGSVGILFAETPIDKTSKAVKFHTE